MTTFLLSFQNMCTDCTVSENLQSTSFSASYSEALSA